MSCFISKRVIGAAITLLATGALAQTPEPQLEGRWWLEEKRLVMAFTREPGGGWVGVVEQSARKADVGEKVFRGLRYRPDRGDFAGTLVMPEDGSSHDVVVRTSADGALRAEVGVFIFTKTLVLRRRP